MNELPRVLFSNVALMELIGFNAHQIEEGLTKRGDSQRKSKKKQGPVSSQCLADNICKLSREQMESLFNQMVQLLVKRGLLDGKRLVALDGSKLPTPPSYEGAGKLKQTRSVKIKGQKERATEEYYVFGFKVLVLIDVPTRVPLTMKVVQIQEYEGRWLVPLLEQAQRNLGRRGHIECIVIDRGYLDGADLWQVHQQGVLFVVTSKAGMAVTADALALAKGERGKVREQVVRHGKEAKEERLRTELVGIEVLTSYDAYGDPEQTQDAHRRDYTGQPLNAVVVRCWNNRVPKGEGTVYLTNGLVSDPFVTFDRYDARSVIENGVFKEGKYPWHLGCFPKKTQAAVSVHTHFTLLVMALSTAFALRQGESGLYRVLISLDPVGETQELGKLALVNAVQPAIQALTFALAHHEQKVLHELVGRLHRPISPPESRKIVSFALLQRVFPLHEQRDRCRGGEMRQATRLCGSYSLLRFEGLEETITIRWEPG